MISLEKINFDDIPTFSKSFKDRRRLSKQKGHEKNGAPLEKQSGQYPTSFIDAEKRFAVNNRESRKKQQ